MPLLLNRTNSAVVDSQYMAMSMDPADHTSPRAPVPDLEQDGQIYVVPGYYKHDPTSAQFQNVMYFPRNNGQTVHACYLDGNGTQWRWRLITDGPKWIDSDYALTTALLESATDWTRFLLMVSEQRISGRTDAKVRFQLDSADYDVGQPYWEGIEANGSIFSGTIAGAGDGRSWYLGAKPTLAGGTWGRNYCTRGLIYMPIRFTWASLEADMVLNGGSGSSVGTEFDTLWNTLWDERYLEDVFSSLLFKDTDKSRTLIVLNNTGPNGSASLNKTGRVMGDLVSAGADIGSAETRSLLFQSEGEDIWNSGADSQFVSEVVGDHQFVALEDIPVAIGRAWRGSRLAMEQFFDGDEQGYAPMLKRFLADKTGHGTKRIRFASQSWGTRLVVSKVPYSFGEIGVDTPEFAQNNYVDGFILSDNAGCVGKFYPPLMRHNSGFYGQYGGIGMPRNGWYAQNTDRHFYNSEQSSPPRCGRWYQYGIGGNNGSVTLRGDSCAGGPVIAGAATGDLDLVIPVFAHEGAGFGDADAVDTDLVFLKHVGGQTNNVLQWGVTDGVGASPENPSNWTELIGTGDNFDLSHPSVMSPTIDTASLVPASGKYGVEGFHLNSVGESDSTAIAVAAAVTTKNLSRANRADPTLPAYHVYHAATDQLVQIREMSWNGSVGKWVVQVESFPDTFPTNGDTIEIGLASYHVESVTDLVASSDPSTNRVRVIRVFGTYNASQSRMKFVGHEYRASDGRDGFVPGVQGLGGTNFGLWSDRRVYFPFFGIHAALGGTDFVFIGQTATSIQSEYEDVIDMWRRVSPSAEIVLLAEPVYSGDNDSFAIDFALSIRTAMRGAAMAKGVAYFEFGPLLGTVFEQNMNGEMSDSIHGTNKKYKKMFDALRSRAPSVLQSVAMRGDVEERLLLLDK
jgi:hypothetical protein